MENQQISQQDYEVKEKLTRKHGIQILVVGLVLTIFDYFLLIFSNHYYVIFIIGAPMLLFLGIAGVINPKFLISKNKSFSESIVGIIFLVAGFIIGLLGVYFLNF